MRLDQVAEWAGIHTVAANMLKKGLDAKFVQRVTNLSSEQIDQLAKEYTKPSAHSVRSIRLTKKYVANFKERDPALKARLKAFEPTQL